MRIMDDNLSEDTWRTPYIGYILHQTLPKELKLLTQIKREAWLFEVILDLVGSPQLHKKMTEFIPRYRCVSKRQGIAILGKKSTLNLLAITLELIASRTKLLVKATIYEGARLSNAQKMQVLLETCEYDSFICIQVASNVQCLSSYTVGIGYS